MKKGDVVFAEYRNSLVEVLSVKEDIIEIIILTLGDLFYAVKVPRKALKKIGEL